jgi:hypothetical protein
MRTAALLLWLAVGLGLSCNPYDPNLGETPFLCGLSDPKCPDGYTAVDISIGRCVCQLHPPSIDAGAEYQCTTDRNDVIERNDSVSRATDTGIDDLHPTSRFPEVAICPADDVDVYKIAVSRAGSTIALIVAFDISRRPPSLGLLDKDGVPLPLSVDSHLPGQLSASYLVSTAGNYFVQVAGAKTAPEAVNYGLTVTLTPP